MKSSFLLATIFIVGGLWSLALYSLRFVPSYCVVLNMLPLSLLLIIFSESWNSESTLTMLQAAARTSLCLFVFFCLWLLFYRRLADQPPAVSSFLSCFLAGCAVACLWAV